MCDMVFVPTPTLLDGQTPIVWMGVLDTCVCGWVGIYVPVCVPIAFVNPSCIGFANVGGGLWGDWT